MNDRFDRIMVLLLLVCGAWFMAVIQAVVKALNP